jgi:hypothetical protein
LIQRKDYTDEKATLSEREERKQIKRYKITIRDQSH